MNKIKLDSNKFKITILSMLIVGGVIVAGTIAALTSVVQRDNKFTVGNIEVDIEEPEWPDTPPEVYPGEEITKDPTIVAKSGDMYGRIRLIMGRTLPKEESTGKIGDYDGTTFVEFEGNESNPMFDGYYEVKDKDDRTVDVMVPFKNTNLYEVLFDYLYFYDGEQTKEPVDKTQPEGSLKKLISNNSEYNKESANPYFIYDSARSANNGGSKRNEFVFNYVGGVSGDPILYQTPNSMASPTQHNRATLFDVIKVSSDPNNGFAKYLKSDVDDLENGFYIIAQAEAVQSKNFSGTTGQADAYNALDVSMGLKIEP